MTVPAIRPGTRHDPFGVSLRGRLAGGVRQWDPYPGNWVRGVGPRAKQYDHVTWAVYGIRDGATKASDLFIVFWPMKTSGVPEGSLIPGLSFR